MNNQRNVKQWISPQKIAFNNALEGEMTSPNTHQDNIIKIVNK